MKAIVYTSQTGHTQRYAQMLAERTGVPAYSLKEAGKSLRRGEEIFYMGWLMAGTVKGLQSAMDRYTIRGAAIVGVSPQGNGDLWTEARINGGYSDSGGRLFRCRPGERPPRTRSAGWRRSFSTAATLSGRRRWMRSSAGSARAPTTER